MILSDALAAVEQGAVLVTAGRRLARSLRSQYDRARQAGSLRVWATASIQPWQSWLDQLWEEALLLELRPPHLLRLDSAQERALWERIIREGDQLLQVRATAEAALGTWSLLKQWRVRPSDIEASATEDSRAFLRWAEAFEAHCRERGWIGDSTLPDILSPLLPGLPLPGQLLLAGFEEFTPQQREFLEACRAAGAEIAAVEAAESDPGTALRQGVADFREEIAAAAGWARAILEEQPGATLGVVVPNLQETRQQVERAFADVFDPASLLPAGRPRGAFNISAGRPLSRYAPVRAALLILRLAPRGNQLADVSALLRSPYLAGAAAELPRRGLLDARLRELGDARVSMGRVRALCERYGCPVLATRLGQWRELRSSLPDKQRPSQWSRSFSRLALALGWPGDETLESFEYQTVEAWNNLLSRFARLDVVLDRLTYSEALSEIARLASESMYQPDGQEPPVQILGLLEASGQRFDHLWIAGLHDENWPPPARPDPFLPPALQRALQLPHSSAERELEFATRLTRQLLRSAKSVVVSYPLREGDRELGPSPLIALLPESTLRHSYTPLVEAVRRIGVLEQLADSQGPPVPAGTWQKGGSKVFEEQSGCPFHAFAELRLDARPLEFPQDGLSNKDRGTLVHRALETIWKDLVSQRELLRRSPEELAALVQSAVCAALDSLGQSGLPREPLAPRLRELEQSRLERLLLAWLEIEKQRPPFVLIEPEQERHVELGGIVCKLILDRIDLLPDGRQAIIDYKTGKSSLSAWKTERPEKPQLPLYAILHGQALGALLLAQVRTGESRFLGYSAEDLEIRGAAQVNLEEELGRWQTVLERLAGEFRAGRAEVNPKNPGKACRLCGLAALCRVGEMELSPSAFEEDANA